MRRLVVKGWLFLCIWVAGCDEKKSDFREPDRVDRAEPREVQLQTNRLEGLPGEVYRTQADSPIRWQPWTRKSLELARDSKRLVLALVVMPQQPTFKEILAEMESNGNIVEAINEDYVPILIDGDAVREAGLLTADLCAEIGSGLQLPLMVWMTPDASPVAWIPVPGSRSASIEEVFTRSHSMVMRMWMDDKNYIASNSRMDQENRRNRLAERRESRVMSDQPETDSIRALRQLTSLYDPLSRTFDEIGGLFPTGSLDLLSTGARLEHVPDDIQDRSRSVLEDLTSDLLRSPMFDPLDGGVFSSRRGSTWFLPGFYRDCGTQARVVCALIGAYGVTGDELVMERALGVLEFAEQAFKTKEGLFRLGSEAVGSTEDWLWRMEDVREILTDEEAEFWVRASGMEEIGNLPSEVDPRREYFRANSIRFAKTAAEVAQETGADLEEVKEKVSSARRKLLKTRAERLEHSRRIAEPNAAASFRMVSAYAGVYRATGDETYRERAIRTLEAARQHFSDGPRLQLYAGDAAPSLVAARAFVYGLALHAALDVGAITLEETWLRWADDLATTTAEMFSAEDYLKESPPEADLLRLPVSDTAMVFDESTAGLISAAEARMEALGRPMLNSFATLANGLPAAATVSPILHTDVIQTSLLRHYGTKLVYGSEVRAGLRSAISRVSPRLETTVYRPDAAVLEVGGVARVNPDGTAVPISSFAEILDPSLRNPAK